MTILLKKRLITAAEIVGLAVAISLILFLYLNPGQKPEDKFFKNDGFYLTGLDKFIVKDKFVPNYSDYNEENVLAEKDGEIIKIKTIFNSTRTQTEKYSSYQFLLFEGLFESKLPPYPEFLTRQTGCAKEFLPVLKTGDYGNYYLTYADERFNYGLCASDLIKYKSAYGIFYCEPSQKLFKIEYFVPLEVTEPLSFNQLDNFFKSFNCL